MPSLVEGDDRQTVKRVVPKATNKIHAVGIAKLYIAYPDRQRWTYTGLQGAAVLANDLVGNTFWIKMVDVSPANRGVIWDQEIYDTFQYNQDRVFFHTFELEECLAGLSFADDKEAKKFKQKMDEREKLAHKNTKSKSFGNEAGRADDSNVNGKSHGLLGGIGSLLHRDRSSNHHVQSQSIIPPKDISIATTEPKSGPLDHIDPTLLEELLGMGLTRDQLAENAGFIKMYVDQKKSTADADERRARAPPPPPAISPQGTGQSRRGPPPAPPPARRTATNARPPSPPPEASATSPPPGLRFRAPPPLADAGKFAGEASAPSPGRPRASSQLAHPGPPPPPRPPKTPMDDTDTSGPRFGVPPPFEGDRGPPPPPPGRNSGGPPPPPARNSVPPPPPARDSTSSAHMVPPPLALGPPLPPKASNGTSPQPPTPARDQRAVPPPPSTATNMMPPPPPPPMPSSGGPPPPPPPMPSSGGPPPPPPPPMPSSNGPPPPPPMPSSGGPPPPPPPMPASRDAAGNAPLLPTPSGERGGLLADIRGGARLKKVSEQEKRDRSGALVPGGAGGGADAPASGAPAPPGTADQGGLAGALASALAARKSKVSASDDEDDKDEW